MKSSVPDGRPPQAAGFSYSPSTAMVTPGSPNLGGAGGAPAGMAEPTAPSTPTSSSLLPQGGDIVMDPAKTLATVGMGIGTGMIDLGLLGVDLARATVGNMKWDEVGEDRDNPLTKWRIDNLTPKSTVFQGVALVGEVASWFVGGKWIGQGIGKGAGAIAPRVAGGLAKGAKAADLGDTALDVAKGDRVVGGLMSVGQKLFGAGEKSERFANLGARGASAIPDLVAGSKPAAMLGRLEKASLYDAERLARAMGTKGFARRAGQALKETVGDVWAASPQEKMRLFGENVLLDAFAGFMTTGKREGLDSDTSGLPRWMAENTPPMLAAGARFLVPEEQDSAMVLRAKATAENSLLGLVLGPVVDAGRIAWMARDFDKLAPEMQQQIGRLLAKPELATDLVGQQLRKEVANAPVGAAAAAVAGDVGEAGAKAVDGGAAAAATRPAVAPEPPRAKGLDDLAALKAEGEATNAQRREMNSFMEDQQVIQQAEAVLRGPQAAPIVDGALPADGALAPLAGQAEGAVAAPAVGGVLEEWKPLPTPEVVLSPGAIREAARADIGKLMLEAGPGATDPEKQMEALALLRQKVVELMPSTRAGRVDYVKTFSTKVNRAGVTDPVDAIWFENTLQTGLDEGWVRVSPDFSSYTFNRQLAAEIDDADKWARKADAMHANTTTGRLVDQPPGPAPGTFIDNSPEAAAVRDAQGEVLAAGDNLKAGMREAADRQAPSDVAAAEAGTGAIPPAGVAPGPEVAPGAAPPAGAVPGPEVAAGVEEVPLVQGVPVDYDPRRQELEKLLVERRVLPPDSPERKALGLKIKTLTQELDSEGGMPSANVAADVDPAAARQAVDAEEISAFGDATFSPVTSPIPPMLTDSYFMAIKTTEKQETLLRSLLGEKGIDEPFVLRTIDGKLKVGAKQLGDALQLLEEQIESGDLSPQDLRTAGSLARTLRERFTSEGAEIGYRSDIEAMVAETKNDIFGDPNCDLTALL